MKEGYTDELDTWLFRLGLILAVVNTYRDPNRHRSQTPSQIVTFLTDSSFHIG